MLIFTPTELIFPHGQFLSYWYRFEAKLVGNNIWKGNQYSRLNFWQYWFPFIKILGDLYFLQTPSNAPSHHRKTIFLRQYSSTKSYWIYHLKATTIGLSVATMYDTIHNFVWLPWQPFTSRTLTSWGLFVKTTQRNIELLMHNLVHSCVMWHLDGLV